ncbi:MAG: GTP pyrophosphokinase family protein [Lachnospiraceae bacterium]|jgi:putative GTP pyrophosphokinase|nr:GTP pyrophosphokinase family protein [Lachnospiraceae bacterium]MCR5466961.1 GTP pyrophosphokinase family protein [Lachnospiraceae bacterium]
MEIQLWREFLDPYALAVDELILKFNHLMTAFRKQDDYCPIEQVQGRVKSIASIIEKANRKKIPLETIEDDMWDICGIRLICQFVEDCYQVVDMIKSRTDMEVVSENDYIAFPKDSGYRSYHLRILYPVQSVGGPKKVHGEIQVRTLGMNSWSTIEHSLQYKYRSNIPDELKMRLRNAADGMIATDKELSSIRDEIRSARELRFEEERIVNDILLTIQNLYRFVSHREAVRIQEEFYNIYKEQNLEKLRHFAVELDIIAEGYRAQTVN